MTETIETTKGELPVDDLEIRLVHSDEPEATIDATEYWLDNECVRRDVNIALKGKQLFGFTQAEF